MRRFNPEKELYKIQHGNRNKIIFCVFLLLIIIGISSSYALYQVRYSKRIIYTKVAPFSNVTFELPNDVTLTPSKARLVSGETKEFTASIPTGYKISTVTCTNSTVSDITGDTFKLGFIKSGQSVCTVSIKSAGYEVTIKLNPTNAATVDSATKNVEANNDISFSISLSGKYIISSVSCTNSQTSEFSDTSVTIKNVTSNTECTVNFTTYTLDKTFPYTSGIQTFLVERNGTYKLEVWGAQGGKGKIEGGLGGYSYGNIWLTKGTTLYIVVGGAGAGTGAHKNQAGGYNGGGAAKADSDGNSRQASGGGATHIATKTGLLSELESYKSQIIIVAGGGGGMAFNSAVNSSWDSVAGTGGGLQGGTQTYLHKTNSSKYYYGYGGTQSSGGSCLAYNHTVSECINGTFGQGGGGTGCFGGAGGGYYGGGCRLYTGGGGSGYLSSRLTSSSTTSGQHSGNGQARISYVGY